MKLKWTKRALLQLIHAQDYIAKENPAAAQAVAECIADAARLLRTQSWIGRSDRNVHFGDINSPVTQQAAGLGRADAVYVTLRDMEQAKSVAVTLKRLYPLLDVYVRVRTLKDQNELLAKGIKHAGTGYIESTLVRGSMLLKGIGMPEADVQELIKDFQRDDYALIRSAYAEAKSEQ